MVTDQDIVDILDLGGIEHVSSRVHSILQKHGISEKFFSDEEITKIKRYELWDQKGILFEWDTSFSISGNIRSVLESAMQYGKLSETPALNIVLEHLVGATLDIVLGEGKVTHHSASEADEAEGRAGDFVLADVAIHVTTHPGEALMAKCARNISDGLRPLIVTTSRQTSAADEHAERAGIALRVDTLDVEQFLAANLYERALFSAKNHIPKTAELLARYNELIDAHETDPSLKIKIAGK